MVWTDTTRPLYERKSDRYASDLTDDEWQLVEPYMPPPHAYALKSGHIVMSLFS